MLTIGAPTSHVTPAEKALVASLGAELFTLDFDSDEPLPVCPMRKQGMREEEICEACQ